MTPSPSNRRTLWRHLAVLWEEAPSLCLLFLLFVALFSTALFFPPSDHDDLVLMMSVARQPSPFAYLWGDWGIANNRYRPLHSMTLWAMYRLFGVWAFPQQALNLGLHLLNVCLLYRLVRRLGHQKLVAFLAAAAILASLYTASPAIWVSDRPALLALFIILALDAVCPAVQRDVPCARLLLLAGLALMAKESGIILPLFVTIVGCCGPRRRLWLVLPSILLIGLYLVFRQSLFPPDVFGPTESGYILGLRWYEDWTGFPLVMRVALAAENIVKGFIAVFLPIFNLNGGFYTFKELLLFSPIWLATALLTAFYAKPRRRLSMEQKYALLLIGLNALLHFGLFRFRSLYVSQVAFALLIAASPWLGAGTIGGELTRKRGQWFVVLMAVLLLGSALWVSREIDTQWTRRTRRLAVLQRGNPVVDQVLDRYGQYACR